MAIDMPRNRRSFASDLDELRYLAEKIEYWLHVRDDPRPVVRFVGRFERLLNKNRRKLSGSIILHEHFALLYDLLDDIDEEIKHREKMITLIRRLHESGGPVEGRYGRQELIDDMIVLAALYYDAGRMNRARKMLEQARDIADEHDLQFEEPAFFEESMARRVNHGQDEN